jgi:hypothetical protein
MKDSFIGHSGASQQQQPALCAGHPQWIAEQQLARQGTKCFWRGPVGQQKSAQRHEGTNVPSCGVLAGTEDDRLRQQMRAFTQEP